MSKHRALCIQCGVPLPPTQPRLVVGGHWHCPDCVYELEHGPSERREPASRPSPQVETLFPLPPPTPRKRR